MKMKPMGDQLLLKAREQKENIVNGIILTTKTSEYGFADVISQTFQDNILAIEPKKESSCYQLCIQ